MNSTQRIAIWAAAVVCLTGGQNVRGEWMVEMLTTRGSAYERGLEHGRAMRAQIHEVFESGLGAEFRQVEQPPEKLGHFLRTLAALEHGAELIEEMQGIAEASGVSLRHIVALNLCSGGAKFEACTVVMLPRGEDGPLMLNSYDESAAGRERRRSFVLQTIYPTRGRAMIVLGIPGTVWAWRGINESGLAVGNTSGGVGNASYNRDGLAGGVAMRYAVQFYERTPEATAFVSGHRQVFKPANIALLDRAGRAAVIEYSATAAPVRRSENGTPLWATNVFLHPDHPPLSDKQLQSAYVRNALARQARLETLLKTDRPVNWRFGEAILRDHADGQVGQILQNNDVMVTAVANIWSCRDGGGWFYERRPDECEATEMRLDVSRRPSDGAAAPPSAELEALLRAGL